jgi:hypothetical protein
MARRKNVKRIDPRYFLHETVNRNDDGSALDEGAGTATVTDPDVHRRSYEDDPVSYADPESLGMEPMRAPDWGPAGEEYFARTGGDPNWEKDFATWKAEKKKRYAAQFKEGEELEEGCPHAEEGGEAIDISAPGMEVHVDDISQLSPEEAFAAGMAAARDAIDQAMGVPDGPPPEEAEGIPLQEREGETPEDIAARLKNIPATMRAGAVNDFFNMMDGSTEMAGHYPHVEDHAEFALQVLKLLGEVPASFRYTGKV